ncbi:MAG: hypothetical protein Q4C46_04565 [Bacillota bacterium]|nr:hypothetical protein [Bacillota bacterium]
MLQYLLKTVASILIPAIMQLNLVDMVSTSPANAAADFMDGLRAGDSRVMEKHIDNEYVNFLVNAEGDEEVVKRMKEAVFRNFTYEIEEIGTKNDVAVARIAVKNSDFSKVDYKYEKAAYDYIMDNLYKDKIADKTKLSAKCLEIYVKQLEKAADKGATYETVVYVPMVDNGYYGWNIIVTDELMQDIMGNYIMPPTKKA